MMIMKTVVRISMTIVNLFLAGWSLSYFVVAAENDRTSAIGFALIFSGSFYFLNKQIIEWVKS